MSLEIVTKTITEKHWFEKSTQKEIIIQRVYTGKVIRIMRSNLDGQTYLEEYAGLILSKDGKFQAVNISVSYETAQALLQDKEIKIIDAHTHIKGDWPVLEDIEILNETTSLTIKGDV